MVAIQDIHVKCSFVVQNSKSMIISVPCTNFYIALSQVKYIIDKDIFKKKVLLGYAMMYEPYVMFGIIFCPWQKREFG